MKIDELDRSIIGCRIRVTKVAPSLIPHYLDDEERLMGECGTAEQLTRIGTAMSQLDVKWETKRPGSLMLAGNDEVEVA